MSVGAESHKKGERKGDLGIDDLQKPCEYRVFCLFWFFENGKRSQAEVAGASLSMRKSRSLGGRVDWRRVIGIIGEWRYCSTCSGDEEIKLFTRQCLDDFAKLTFINYSTRLHRCALEPAEISLVLFADEFGRLGGSSDCQFAGW